MKNTTYSDGKVAAGATYSAKCFEGDGKTIAAYFPEHARAEIEKHFKEGLIPLDNMMNWKTNAMINNDLYKGTLDFTGKLIDAIFAYGFIEGRRSATCCQASFDDAQAQA